MNKFRQIWVWSTFIIWFPFLVSLFSLTVFMLAVFKVLVALCSLVFEFDTSGFKDFKKSMDKTVRSL